MVPVTTKSLKSLANSLLLLRNAFLASTSAGAISTSVPPARFLFNIPDDPALPRAGDVDLPGAPSPDDGALNAPDAGTSVLLPPAFFASTT